MTIQTQYLTPTEIGKELEKSTGQKISGIKVNQLLKIIKLQYKVGKLWQPTILGKGLSVILPYSGKNNHCGFQVKWSTDIIQLLKNKL